jgi:hypothetical protein
MNSKGVAKEGYKHDIMHLLEAYNASRGWDSLPDWKSAADLWVARMRERGEEK